jgi:hypothetical protein
MAELAISDVINRYSERCTENNVFLTESTPLCVRGNVVSVRKHGKISFMTISDKDSELQLVLRDKIDPFPTPKSIVTAVGFPGKTSTGQLSLLVHQLAINELAPPNIPPPRQTQRQRKRHVSRGEQLVVDRADALYGSLFPLGETDETSADVNFGSLDPTLNIPDQDDKRRLAWADRKRPQVAWMIEKVRELLDRRKAAGLRSVEILVCAKRSERVANRGPKAPKDAYSAMNRFRFNLNITTLIGCNNTVLLYGLWCFESPNHIFGCIMGCNAHRCGRGRMNDQQYHHPGHWRRAWRPGRVLGGCAGAQRARHRRRHQCDFGTGLCRMNGRQGLLATLRRIDPMARLRHAISP